MRVFVDARGKTDNLGDSVLRRAWLDALRPLGDLNVLVGDDAQYTSGLGLADSDTADEQWGQWFRRALRTGTRERIVFALNAGEFSVHRQFAKRLAWQTALAAVARTRGGTVLLAGAGFRGDSTLLARGLRPVISFVVIVSWRDDWSRFRHRRGQPGLGDRPGSARARVDLGVRWTAGDRRVVARRPPRAERRLADRGSPTGLRQRVLAGGRHAGQE